MSDEHSNPSSGSGKQRRRRRPSRKRRRPSQPKSNGAPNAQSGQTEGEGGSSGSSRRRRRRRKSRAQGSENQRQEPVVARDMLDAKLPESIFVYTHVLRSAELDTYGYRPDPFLNRSRSLEDFRIDLSPLFPEDDAGGDGEGDRIFDAALHGPIVTTLADSADDAEGDDEEAGDGEDEEGDLALASEDDE